MGPKTSLTHPYVKPGQWAVMYVCVRDIDCTPVFTVSILNILTVLTVSYFILFHCFPFVLITHEVWEQLDTKPEVKLIFSQWTGCREQQTDFPLFVSWLQVSYHRWHDFNHDGLLVITCWWKGTHALVLPIKKTAIC